MKFSKISAEKAYETIRHNERSRYARNLPAPDSGEYAEPAFTPGFSISRDDTIFTMGSCFARNIERFLVEQNFSVPMHTFRAPPEECCDSWAVGRSLFNKYNPFSMLNAINGAIGEIDLSRSIVEMQGGVLDLQLHTDKPVTRERALQRTNQINELFLNALKASRIVVVTLGLIEAWYDRESELYINAPPPIKVVKSCPDRFDFEVLSPQKVIDTLDKLFDTMKRHGHPDQKVLLTVSPVPLGRTFTPGDAITANQYSKSVLRTAAEYLTRNNPHIDYFPSYESIIYSDRQNTFEEDKIHVRPKAVAFNVNRMIDAYCKV